MGRVRFGPSGLPRQDEPEPALDELVAAGYDACEVGFATGFWMDYDWAGRLGEAARERDVMLSIHAPLAGFMGHLDDGKKFKMAIGMLDHTAGLAAACGAEVIVFHPGFLLGRERKEALASVVEQLAELRERLEGKGRDVDFGVEIMGRVRELGTAEDVFAISRALPWVRPVIDFAHLHAVTDGAFTTVKAFHDVLKEANRLLTRGTPFHIHFSDIAYASVTLEDGRTGGNENRHLPYGEGTLRADPMAKALARFARPATVISESPNEESHQAIRSILVRNTQSRQSRK